MGKTTRVKRAGVVSVMCSSVIAALAGSAAGASSVPGTEPPSEPTDSSAAPAPVDIELQIDMALGLLPDDELDAYYQAEQAASEERVRACMEDAGFEYNVNTQNLGSPQMGPTTPEEQLAWAEDWGFGMWTTLNPASDPWAAEGEVEYLDANEFVQDLSPEEQTEWYDANAECSAAAYGDAADDPWLNPMVQAAMADFQVWVEEDPRTAQAHEAWSQCMDDAGQPFADQTAMYDAVWGVDETGDLQNQFFASEAWNPDSPDHEQWQGLVDNEIAIALADATCTPALNEAILEVQIDLRPRLVEAWEAVDWSLPPATVPLDGETFDVSTPPVATTL